MGRDHHHHSQRRPRHSPLDRLDPRVRLVSMAVWVGVAAWLSHTSLLSILLVLAVMVGALSGATRLFERLGIVTIALLPAWVMLPLFGMDAPIYSAGPVHVHGSGLLAASVLQARACIIVSVVIGHQGITPWNRWVWAAGKLGVPASLLNLFTITLRYLPLIGAETRRTSTAARARGFEAGADLRSYGVLASMAGSGMVRSYLRSERLYRAMLSRGYRGVFHPLKTESVDSVDIVFAGLSLCLAAALIIFAAGVVPWH